MTTFLNAALDHGYYDRWSGIMGVRFAIPGVTVSRVAIWLTGA